MNLLSIMYIALNISHKLPVMFYLIKWITTILLLYFIPWDPRLQWFQPLQTQLNTTPLVRNVIQALHVQVIETHKQVLNTSEKASWTKPVRSKILSLLSLSVLDISLNTSNNAFSIIASALNSSYFLYTSLNCSHFNRLKQKPITNMIARSIEN